MKFLVINGVNMNMVGTRQTNIYGIDTLQDINDKISDVAKNIGDKVDFYQSNIEGELVECLHSAKGYNGVILNAGAYTHYSIAIRDAISSIKVPVVEVHMSNVHAREEFRHTSVLSAVCCGVIAGFGTDSYTLALMALHNIKK